MIEDSIPFELTKNYNISKNEHIELIRSFIGPNEKQRILDLYEDDVILYNKVKSNV